MFFQFFDFQAINGFSQSTGWPSVVTVMGNWYSQAGRGLVMGVWSSCQSIGNILGNFYPNFDPIKI